MADERFCRFSTKITCAGVTLVDGILSVSAIDIIINRIMFENNLPLINFKDLYAKPKGHHVHFDIVANGNLIAFELSALSGPVVFGSR